MNRKLREEKGSVILYVFVTLIVLIMMLVATYMSITNRHIADLEVGEQIKSIYEKDVNNINEIYATLISE